MSNSVFKRLINSERKCKKHLPCLEDLEQIHPNINTDSNKKNKTYGAGEWEKIYQQRFMTYQIKKEEKLLYLIKQKKIKERIKEEEDIKLCKVKTAPLKVTDSYGKRMYEEALKRQMKRQNNSNKPKTFRPKPLDDKQIDKLFKQNLDKILEDEKAEQKRKVPKPLININDNTFNKFYERK